MLTKAFPATFKVEIKIKEWECLGDVHIQFKNKRVITDFKNYFSQLIIKQALRFAIMTSRIANRMLSHRRKSAGLTIVSLPEPTPDHNSSRLRITSFIFLKR
jgi:hypothetical protein